MYNKDYILYNVNFKSFNCGEHNEGGDVSKARSGVKI